MEREDFMPFIMRTASLKSWKAEEDAKKCLGTVNAQSSIFNRKHIKGLW